MSTQTSPVTPRFFMHTPKAVKAGCPENRLFVVHNEFQEGRATYFNAWKCQVTSAGIVHPGTTKPMNLQRVQNPVKLTKEGLSRVTKSEPTAQFKKDSFYKELTIADVAKVLSLAQ